MSDDPKAPTGMVVPESKTGVLVHRDGVKGKRRVGKRGLQVIREMAADGQPDASIARALKMHRETFRDCRRRDDAVEAALVEGRASMEHVCVNSLLENVRAGGAIATTPAIFLLKSRCGYRDDGSSPPGFNVSGENVQINLTPQLTDEQFQQLLQRSETDE